MLGQRRSLVPLCRKRGACWRGAAHRALDGDRSNRMRSIRTGQRSAPLPEQLQQLVRPLIIGGINPPTLSRDARFRHLVEQLLHKLCTRQNTVSFSQKTELHASELLSL
jgi:hypothetical protein